MMGFGLSTAPRLYMAMECTVCHEYIDSDRVSDTRVLAKLFGAAKYSVCSGCGMEIPGPWTSAYKRRWTLRRNKIADAGEQPLQLDADTIASLSRSDDAPRKLKRGALLHKSAECKRHKHTFCSGSHCICSCHAVAPEPAKHSHTEDACKVLFKKVYPDAYVTSATNDSTKCRVFIPSTKEYVGPWVKKPKLAWKRAWEYLQAGLDKKAEDSNG